MSIPTGHPSRVEIEFAGVGRWIGILHNGRRSILGTNVALSEAEVHWREFLVALQARGLTGVEYVVSDDHPGIKHALRVNGG